MASAAKTVERMGGRVDHLIATFPACLNRFDSENLFSGPSLYFYFKARAARARHATAVEALEDDDFFDGLYATLTAWGMHRMGPGKAKLADLAEIKASFARQSDLIRDLEGEDIASISDSRLPLLVDQLWNLMSGLRVGIGKTKIVANSKALHLLLPALMPPIDGEYTIRFFYHHKTLSQRGDEKTFKEIYPHLRRIATSCHGVIEERVAAHNGMDTCATKVIDNAIVGYVRTHLSKGRVSD